MKTKFALVNGERQKPQPGLKGKCEICDDTMDAKCGRVRVWHWAHKAYHQCDTWWKPETEWHRNWKERFPEDWQEVVHTAENGVKHRADVKTDEGWAIEFQHSPIKPDVRQARENFYPKLVWVVNGARLDRDIKQFQNALNKGMLVDRNLSVRRVFSDKCLLLQKWADSDAPIFFDFGGDMLWWRIYWISSGMVYVGPFSRTGFIEIHHGGTLQKSYDFGKRLKDFRGLAKDYESYLQAQALKQVRPQPPRGFRRRMPGRRL